MPLRYVLALCALAPTAAGQHDAVGTCAPGRAVGIVETEAVRFPVRTDGRLFRSTAAYPGGGYIVPLAEGVPMAYDGAPWLSGYVEGDLRVSAVTYDPDGELWPGPLADADDPPADCAAFDRVWVVSRADVARYHATGEATPDLAEWPHAAGAPVVDGDGDPTTYDLAAGDEPDLLGDVAAFWVMNDAGNAHARTLSAPLGVEVRALAFAFDVPDGGPGALRYASFLRYEVVNRRAVPIDSLRVSLWTDVELGYNYDDHIGVDTLRHVRYAYNGDNLDEGGFGGTPPAWGIQVLRGPVGLPNGRDDDGDGVADEAGERLRLTSSPFVRKAGLYAAPRGGGNPDRYVNIQRGRGRYGHRLFACGSGHADDPSCAPTVFGYPADPAAGAFWSEENVDGAGTPSSGSGDRRMIATTGPGRLAPGASAVIDFAFPFGQGADRLASVTVLRDAAGWLLATYGEGFASRPVASSADRPRVGAVAARVRPNPATSGAAAVLTVATATEVEAVVFDALGRRVAALADRPFRAGETALALPEGLPPGVYLLRVWPEGGAPVSVPFTVLR